MDLQGRIERVLGGGKQDEPAVRAADAAAPIEALVPGYWVTTRSGRVFVGEARFRLDHRHGARVVRELCQVNVAQWPSVLFLSQAMFDLANALFLDTETTGLGRGPGTFCFMVGTGRVVDDELILRQYLAPDYGDEPLLLRLVEEQAALASGLVTFNGRSFDLPLLETRYILNGYARSPLQLLGHLDLLIAARRLWRRSLPSCALGSLETNVLNVERGEDDIPGYLIPEIYKAYLLSGAADEIARVFYHNRYDVLSMVSLVSELGDIFARAQVGKQAAYADPVAVGRLREADASVALAADAYRDGIISGDALVRREARQRLADLLKRQRCFAQATALWLEALEDGLLYPYVELAKYYEHRLHAYGEAEQLVKRALQGVATGAIEHPHPQQALRDLARRLARIQLREENARKRRCAQGQGTRPS